MKRHFELRVGAVAAVCVSGILSSAGAALIDVDFNGRGTDTQTGAAVIGTPTDTWNGVGGLSGTGVGLNNSIGAGTSVTMDFAADDDPDLATGSTFPSSSPVYALMRDLLVSNPTVTDTVTLHGLAAGAYDLYLYSNSDNPMGYPDAQLRVTAFTANGTSGTVGPNNGLGTLTAGANYVLLAPTVDGTGLLTITFVGTASDGLGLFNGFQLVNVPEPTSLILFCLGAVGLLAVAHRRRKA